MSWAKQEPSDQRRLLALVMLAGGGVAMTLYAAAALWWVATVPRYAFWLGAGALLLIAIVLTGFAGLLVKRTIKANVAGNSVEISDQGGDPAAVNITGATP